MTTADATHESRRPGGRYSSVSIGLHWLIAALLVAQIILGGRFEDMPRGPAKGEAFARHLSLGVTILVLSLARLGWRLGHPAPPLPSHYKTWERLLARATHVLFYGVLIGMPLTGWIMTSAGPRDLPEVWGLIPWPKLPGVGEGAGGTANFLHTEIILRSFYVLIALHIAGALKHQFLDRDGTLWRMLPVVSPRGAKLTEAERAAEALRRGELVILPTETVYGLAADASNAAAVTRLYEAKGRPRFNPLIAHVADQAAAERLALFDERARRLAEAFWPGP